MNNDSRYFKLGLFVIGGIAAIVAGVVVLGAGALFTEYITAETATTSSVQGLDVGSAVKYLGVPIGKVSKIEMASWHYSAADPSQLGELNRYIRIEVSVRRDMLKAKSRAEMKANLARNIDAGMRVRMASSGLTGPAFLEVTYLNPQQYPPPLIPWTPDQLYLPSAPGTMTQIVTSVEDILVELRQSNLREAVADVRKLITDADRAINGVELKEIAHRVRQIIDNPNIDRAVNDLSDAVASAKGTISGEQVKAFVEDLPRISANLRQTSTRLDELLSDPKFQRTLDDLNSTAAASAPAAQDLRRVLHRLDQLITTQQADLEAIVLNLRRVLDNGASVVEDAKQNPARMLFGEPPPRIEAGGHK